MKKHVLIAGGGGFVGTRVVKLFSSKKYRVAVLERKKINKVLPGVRVISGDLLRPQSLSGKLKNFDAIIHLAANADVNYSISHSAEIMHINCAMLVNLLDEVARTGRKPLIVFASTDRVYGRTKKRVADEGEALYPLEPYTASKIFGERILELYRNMYGIPYIILRIDSIYGPGQPRSMFISDVIQKMKETGEITAGKLDVRKNFVYVDDVARAFLCAVDARPAVFNSAYNIGGRNVSLKDILNILKPVLEGKLAKKAVVKFRSSFVRKSFAEVRPFALSTRRAKRMLGWSPEITLREGLERTADHFLDK